MSGVIIQADQWARLFWGLVDDGTVLVHDGIEFTTSCEDLTVPAWGLYKRVLVLTATVNGSPLHIHPLGLTSPYADIWVAFGGKAWRHREPADTNADLRPAVDAAIQVFVTVATNLEARQAETEAQEDQRRQEWLEDELQRYKELTAAARPHRVANQKRMLIGFPSWVFSDEEAVAGTDSSLLFALEHFQGDACGRLASVDNTLEAQTESQEQLLDVRWHQLVPESGWLDTPLRPALLQAAYGLAFEDLIKALETAGRLGLLEKTAEGYVRSDPSCTVCLAQRREARRGARQDPPVAFGPGSPRGYASRCCNATASPARTAVALAPTELSSMWTTSCRSLAAATTIQTT